MSVDKWSEYKGSIGKNVNILMSLRKQECKVIRRYCVNHQEPALKAIVQRNMWTRNQKTGVYRNQLRKVTGWRCKLGPEFGKFSPNF